MEHENKLENKDHTKLSVGCVHLLDTKNIPILTFEGPSSRVNEKDTGKLYYCADCIKNGKTEKLPRGNDWDELFILCEDCITDTIVKSLTIKKEIKNAEKNEVAEQKPSNNIGYYEKK